jgi:hypothetical protein
VWVGQDLLGQAVIACQTPECIEQALDAADAEFAIVPALWNRGAGETELTLTLLRREGRNINAEGTLGENADATIETLVAQLFTTRAGAAIAGQEPTRDEPARPNAWLAGPVILIGAGTAGLIAVGVSAATRSDNQQVNTAAVAAWSAVGTAAIAGGIAWWVVGAKRRRGPQGARRKAPKMALGPTSVDLRLRF